MSEAAAAVPSTEGKKKPFLVILIALLAIGAGAGGTWYYMKTQQGDGEGAAQPAKEIPTKFIKLETFTVNLQSEEDDPRYLQVELVIKVNETSVVDTIANKTPEIRNQILLLLSSKKATEISTLEGKQQLSQDISEAIKQKIEPEALQADILDLLFTSFIIQ
ncbi:MAG: flagellar basal body-associated protein FliL [Nitrosomonas sp.]|nr:flagellar basal body-associated protein FliL [Nitrosomonas sp.]